MTITPKPPTGAKTSGARLWRSVLGQYDLDEHELVLLRQAVLVVDACDGLQRVIDRDGVLLTVDGMSRVHPASVELGPNESCWLASSWR
jgi:hypothetical protein